MVNQIEALGNLTMGFQIFLQFVIFILSLIAWYVLLNQEIRIPVMVERAWNAVNLNFERLVPSRKPPQKPPDKIGSIERSWFKLVVIFFIWYHKPKRFVSFITGSNRFILNRFTIVDSSSIIGNDTAE